MPKQKQFVKPRWSAGGLRAARAWIHPVLGDFCQAEECKELAKVIEIETGSAEMEGLIQELLDRSIYDSLTGDEYLLWRTRARALLLRVKDQS